MKSRKDEPRSTPEEVVDTFFYLTMLRERRFSRVHAPDGHWTDDMTLSIEAYENGEDVVVSELLSALPITHVVRRG